MVAARCPGNDNTMKKLNIGRDGYVTQQEQERDAVLMRN